MSVWHQLGDDIDGEVAGDRLGYDVSLSADGLILAVGATGPESDSGHVRVYWYDTESSIWSKLGGDIETQSVPWLSLSADGLTLAVKPRLNDHILDSARVYRYDAVSSAWNQLGGDIDLKDYIISLSLSADGSILAAGAKEGRSRVYQFEADSSSWNQLGDDVAEWGLGFFVSLSGDGLTLALGYNDFGDSGHGRVFRYDSVSSTWSQLGGDVDNNGELGNNISSTFLSADGSTLAVGVADEGDQEYVRVYKLTSCCEESLERITILEADVAELQQQMLTLLDFAEAIDEDFSVHVHDKSTAGKYTDLAVTEIPDPDPDPEPDPEPDPDPASNAVANGGFDSTLRPWKFWSDKPSNTASIADHNGSGSVVMVTVNQSGKNIQLYQSSIELEPNTDYILTFDAYSNTGHDIRVSVSRHDAPYTNYGLNRIVVDLPDDATGWQTHTLPFTTKNFGSSVSNGRLSFWFASDAHAGDHYVFDNVRLVPAVP